MKTIGNVDFFGLPLKIRVFAGTVQEEDTKTTQHIVSSHNLAGDLAEVSSVTKNRQTLWLRNEEGQDVRIAINSHIPVRSGHRLEVFFAATSDTGDHDAGSIVAVRNLNTGKTFDTFGQHGKLPNPGFFKLSMLSIMGPGVATFLGMGLSLLLGVLLLTAGFGMNGFVFSFLGVFAGIIYQHCRATSQISAFKAELDKLIDRSVTTSA